MSPTSLVIRVGVFLFSFFFYVMADLWCIALFHVTVGIEFVLQSKCPVDLFKKKEEKKKEEERNGI